MIFGVLALSKPCSFWFPCLLRRTISFKNHPSTPYLRCPLNPETVINLTQEIEPDFSQKNEF